MKAQVQHTKQTQEGRSYACDPYIVIVLESAHEAEMLWHMMNNGRNLPDAYLRDYTGRVPNLGDAEKGARHTLWNVLSPLYAPDYVYGLEHRNPFRSEPES